MDTGKHTKSNIPRKKWFLFLLILIIIAGILLALNAAIKLNITVNGESKETIEVFTSYEDPGAAATLKLPFSKEKPVDITVEGQVDTNTPGEYKIKYSAKALWKHRSEKRVVTVQDTTAPEITLEQGNSLTLTEGSGWEDSYTATDNVDGDITEKIKITGKYNLDKAGTYEITYSVTDSSGNTAEVNRTITIIEPLPANSKDLTKAVFLTFDDGPGSETGRLLDILKKYDVKATFFVTGANSQYQNLIGRAYQEGHTIAVHTYSHKYDQIYASDAAYWEDFDKMEEIIEKQTGSRTTLFRFPGGSSNLISKNYNLGIMTRLASQADAKGLFYFDWNVDSNDAGGANTSSQVYTNIMNGIHSQNVSVVLCHDIKPYTVDAMEQVISQAKKEGYTFYAAVPGSPTAHHLISN